MRKNVRVLQKNMSYIISISEVLSGNLSDISLVLLKILVIVALILKIEGTDKIVLDHKGNNNNLKFHSDFNTQCLSR